MTRAEPPENSTTSFEAIRACTSPPPGIEIGRSREGRPIEGYRLNSKSGAAKVSLIAGCHADEPVGPRWLTKLVAFLHDLPPSHPFARIEWWIVPHVNPDGAERNRAWQEPGAEVYPLTDYLRHVVRERPGDDIEFDFPAPNVSDDEARPENRALSEWWDSCVNPFRMHATLHGMAWAGGAWFLVEPEWRERAEPLYRRLRARVEALGYSLHDVERHGEKGFHRIAPGFCTRPASAAMREHFLALDDPESAALFRPNSMERIRAHGGDPFTCVSELPLFLLPGVGETLGPPDPRAEEWRDRLEGWRLDLATGRPASEVEREARDAGLRAMPVVDQWRLQWELIVAALELVGALEG